MNFTKSISTFLSIVSLIIHIATADTPLYNICSSKDTCTKNSPYTSNLNNLFTLLSKKSPPTGFGKASIGKAQNKVNGLALCRGDVSSSNCTACINEASRTILSLCPENKGAVIWFDNCMLKYSNLDFFGQIDNQNKFYLYNIIDVATNPEAFNKQVKSLLSKLADKAQKNYRFYAIGDVKLGGSDRLYGLAQCSRDLTSSDCKKCIDDAISELPGCCSGKRGGRTVGGSCNVRYELYQFAGDL